MKRALLLKSIVTVGIGLIGTIILLVSIFDLSKSPWLSILSDRYTKVRSLEQGFKANVPIYPGSEVLSSGIAGNDLNPIPEFYSAFYKIDPNVPVATVRDFYVDQLTKQGWTLTEIKAKSPSFTRGSERINVYLGCHLSPSASSGGLGDEVCSNFPDHYLGARIYYGS